MDVAKIIEMTFAPKVVGGAGSIKQLPRELTALGVSRPLVVTDKGIIKVGLIDKVTSVLKDAQVPYVVFGDVETNPTTEAVESGLKLLKEHRCDGLVAVGGGSAIDTAKSIGVVAQNGGSISEYEGFDKFANYPLPLVAIPTTVGTGSEVTKGAVITDTKRHFKMVIASSKMYAKVALLDPTLLTSLPAFLTAATGMDALTHAIEAYISTGANPIADALNLKAISMIAGSLRQAVASGSVETMYQMQLASCIAGIGFHNVGLGLVHAMAHPVSGYYGVHHGVANAILLPRVMEYNLIACPERFADIAQAMGEETRGLTMMEKASKAIEAVRKLSDDVGIPKGLRQVGVTDETRIEKMAEDTLLSVDLPTNPRRYDKKTIADLYRLSL